jgi:type I restriction enzyme M protein
VGIDVANGPKLARIARLNMYLRGDGGTRIFHLNALDKELADAPTDVAEITKEKIELRRLIGSGGFNVALTNPPFAKAYDRTTDEGTRILDSYVIGRDGGPRSSVRSALLFAERYRDLLKIGGKLVTIIDDGILSGDEYKWFRDKLREWFLIRAVISLPGDAFQRSNARVKTSFLIAEKRDPEKVQAQPPVFMYPCQYIGIDDPKRQRARAGDAEARRLAQNEIRIVVEEYEKFLGGDVQNYSVSPERMAGRFDVKNCLMKPGRSIAIWSKNGFRTLPMSDALEERAYEEEDIIRKDHPEEVRVLVVRYEGVAEGGDDILPAEGSYARLYPVHAGDIVISNIAASHGSIAVVPPELDRCVVSSEYTILKPKPGFDSVILQLILRSPEVRADILLSASGANRTRTRWDLMQNIIIPYPGPEIIARVKKLAQEADDAKRCAAAALDGAREQTETSLLLRSDEANTILAAFRPPK